MINFDFDRLAMIAYLAQNAPNKWIGRKALMKYLYFLQILRGVPLGYHFTLYSYGPFDSSVLNDLGSAEALGLVESTLEAYPSGYGYRIESKIEADDINELGGELLSKNRDNVNWVLKEFGGRNVGELELESTIVFVEGGASKGGTSLPINDLVSQVHDVKPHFLKAEIEQRIGALQNLDLLKHVTPF
jgi:hypothetical protein